MIFVIKTQPYTKNNTYNCTAYRWFYETFFTNLTKLILKN